MGFMTTSTHICFDDNSLPAPELLRYNDRNFRTIRRHFWILLNEKENMAVIYSFWTKAMFYFKSEAEDERRSDGGPAAAV